MRKPKTYYATRGWLTAEGKTNAEAKAKLESMINWACEVDGPYVESRFGMVFVIAQTANGWATIAPFDPVHGASKTASCFCSSERTFESELQSCRIHMAQLAWRQDSDDDEIIAQSGLDDRHISELTYWIGFQRNYIIAKSRGLSNNEAHEWACRTPYQKAA